METHSEEYNKTKARIKAKLDAAIEEDLLNGATSEKPKKSRLIPILVTTLSAAAVLMAAVLINTSRKQQTIDSIKWVEVITAYGEKKAVTLPDSSTIWLHNDSRVIYPDRFSGKTRQVFSSGEVFVKVTPDKKHPFILSSNGVNVCVKGTTFNYRSYPETSDVELTLIEGAVDLKMNIGGIDKTVSVTPGQIVKANLTEGRISQFTFAPEKYVSWKDTKSIYFNDETLETIAVELQRQFDIRIEIRSEALKTTRFYASFLDCDDPMLILKSLNTTGMMHIVQKGNTYFIYPNIY